MFPNGPRAALALALALALGACTEDRPAPTAPVERRSLPTSPA